MSDLLSALHRLAQEKRIQEPGWAERTERRIRRVIRSAKDTKLRYRRYGEYVRPWRERARVPTHRLAAHLVECKIKERRWSVVVRRFSETIQAQVTARAADLLSGAKPKARKNFIEARASEIAAELEKEWFSWKGRKGRPLGNRTYGDDAFLGLEEIIAAVVPLIEEITHTELKPVAVSKDEIKSPAFAVLIAAIRAEHTYTDESIIRTLARLRARAGSGAGSIT